jgi:hypothetical protein
MVMMMVKMMKMMMTVMKKKMMMTKMWMKKMRIKSGGSEGKCSRKDLWRGGKLRGD